jgi:hypothetical protein
MSPILIAFPLASFGLSLALTLGPLALVRRFAPGVWQRLAPRPGRGAFPALVLFVISLALPALWLADAPLLGLQAFLLALMGLDSGGPNAETLACCLGLAANLSFACGLLLRLSPWPAKARFAATAALVLGGVSLVPVAWEFLLLLPGFVLWLLGFEYLRRVSLPEEDLAEEDAAEERRPIAIVASGQAGRCGYCHGEDAVSARACPTCGGVLHEECWLKAERCPTLGCAVRVRRVAA